jgi:hypothetical protein
LDYTHGESPVQIEKGGTELTNDNGRGCGCFGAAIGAIWGLPIGFVVGLPATLLSQALAEPPPIAIPIAAFATGIVIALLILATTAVRLPFTITDTLSIVTIVCGIGASVLMSIVGP